MSRRVLFVCLMLAFDFGHVSASRAPRATIQSAITLAKRFAANVEDPRSCATFLRLTPSSKVVWQPDATPESWVADENGEPAWLSTFGIACAAHAVIHAQKPMRHNPLGSSKGFINDKRRLAYWLARFTTALTVNSRERAQAEAVDGELRSIRAMVRGMCRRENSPASGRRGANRRGVSGSDVCGALDGWQWVGPWPAGKPELEADPLEDAAIEGGAGRLGTGAFEGGIFSPALIRGDKAFHPISELGPDGQGEASWHDAPSEAVHSSKGLLETAVSSDSSGSSPLSELIPTPMIRASMSASGVSWSSLVQSLGSQATLEMQGWGVMSFALLEPSVVEVLCSGSTLAWIRPPSTRNGSSSTGWGGAIPVSADVYSSGWVRWTGALGSGPHELATRVRGRAQATVACAVRSWRGNLSQSAPLLTLPAQGAGGVPDAVTLQAEWLSESDGNSGVLAGSWSGVRVASGAWSVAVTSSRAKLLSDGGTGWTGDEVFWGSESDHVIVDAEGVTPVAQCYGIRLVVNQHDESCVSGAWILGPGQSTVVPVPLTQQAAASMSKPLPSVVASNVEGAELLEHRSNGTNHAVALPGDACMQSQDGSSLGDAQLHIELFGGRITSGNSVLTPQLLGRVVVPVRCRRAGEPVRVALRSEVAGGSVVTATVSMPLPLVGAVDSVHAGGVDSVAKQYGAAIWLSQHGTGVSGDSQADAYKQGRRETAKRAARDGAKLLGLQSHKQARKDAPKDSGGFEFGVMGAAVVAPDRHGAHDWEGPHGYGTVAAVLAAVPGVVRSIRDTSRVLASRGGGIREVKALSAQSGMEVKALSAQSGMTFNWTKLCNMSKKRAGKAETALIGRWWPCADSLDSHRVGFAGHSMGGHGAWVSLGRAVNRAICAWPAAGWLSKESYSDANALLGVADAASAYSGRADGNLRGLLHGTVAGRHAEAIAADAAATVPSIVRTGAEDATVHPFLSRRGARAVNAAISRRARIAVKAFQTHSASGFGWRFQMGSWLLLEEIQGQGHWFWDTLRPNDGGVVADDATRAFIQTCANMPSDAAGQREATSAAVAAGQNDSVAAGQNDSVAAGDDSVRFCAIVDGSNAKILSVLDAFIVTAGDDAEDSGRRGLRLQRIGSAAVAELQIAVLLLSCDGTGDNHGGMVAWQVVGSRGVSGFFVRGAVVGQAGTKALTVVNTTARHVEVRGTTMSLAARLPTGVPVIDTLEWWSRFSPPVAVYGPGQERQMLWTANASQSGGETYISLKQPARATRATLPHIMPRDVWRRSVVIVVGALCNGAACTTHELSMRQALAATISGMASSASHASIQIITESDVGLVKRSLQLGHAVISIGGPEHSRWLKEATMSSSARALLPGPWYSNNNNHSSSDAWHCGDEPVMATLSAGWLVTGDKSRMAPLLVLGGIGNHEVLWGLHAVLAAPTVPPMTRAPWTNLAPQVLAVSQRVRAEGDAAVLFAGTWDWESQALNMADPAVDRCT